MRLGSPTHTMVSVLPLLDTDIYLLHFVCKYRKDVVLLIRLVCLFILSKGQAELSVSRFGRSPSAFAPCGEQNFHITTGGKKENQASSPRASHAPEFLSQGNLGELSQGCTSLGTSPGQDKSNSGVEGARKDKIFCSAWWCCHRLGSVISQGFSKQIHSVML